MSTIIETIPQLASFGNVVPQGYMYAEKHITPGEDLSLPNAYLKWYAIYPSDAEITSAQDAETRAFIATEVERLRFVGELGFVIVHRAGSVLLLMVNTWRNTNEIWESVYVKEVAGAGGYVAVEFAQSHRATYCVWELGAVWHERNAWVRFLSSKRDQEAKLAYVHDRFAGLA